MTTETLPEPAYRFRRALLDALDRFTKPSRFHYIDRDTVVVVCPACDSPMTVRFAGTALRADLTCHAGCQKDEILARLRTETRA